MNDRKISNKVSSNKELSSYEEYFRLYYHRLKNYAFSFLHQADEAEDLVQDVFCQIWQTRSQLDNEKNVGSFLFTLLRNKCLNALRHKVVEEQYAIQKNKFHAEELYHISFMETEEFVSMEERLMAQMEIIIAEMPPKCQIAFRLKWVEGKKIREIAEIMEVSTTMVDKHLSKGIQIARRKLKPDLFIFFLVTFVKE